MEFDDLYREIILDHYRNPRNQGNLDHLSEANVHENPSCGDSLKLEITVGESAPTYIKQVSKALLVT